MMNIIGLIKYAGLAWKDKGQIEELVTQAKIMEGPKPSWKTGEFWINIVIPTIAGILGGATAVVSAPALVPYFIIATTVLSLGAYLGRQWLKGKHLVANSALDLTSPEIQAQLATIIQNVTATVSAVKDATKGNTDAATKISETLNAPEVTVNVAK